METKKTEINKLTEKIIGLVIEVHRNLGPGLLENVYKKCLSYELKQAKIDFELEKELPIYYKGIKIDCNYRLDIIINKILILELKSVDKLMPVHEAQILTYMKLTNTPVGLLINFNEAIVINGIKRFLLKQ